MATMADTTQSSRRNVNVPNGKTFASVDTGNPVRRVITPRGAVTASADRKVTPLSVPASYGNKLTVRLFAHSPFSIRLKPDTPTNQSGLGATIEQRVTSG